MAEQSYLFDISTDFPGGEVNAGQFQTEIQASGIVTALERIDAAGGAVDQGVRTGGTLDVVFKAPLSTGDATILHGDTSAPAGGLIAAHIAVASVETPRLREDGVLYSVPKPSSFGLVMCDRDFRINTCMVTTATAVEDLKMNTQTNKEEDWGEMALAGVYKNDAGDMVLCADQADADVNGVLSVWDYYAKSGGNPISYEVRDGLLYVDSALPTGENWDHRAYAIVAPAIPGNQGGSITVFDAYLGSNPNNTVEALSPQATVLDPTGPAGVAASTLRLYIVHPAGSKLSHVLRLVTYRAPGTF